MTMPAGWVDPKRKEANQEAQRYAEFVAREKAKTEELRRKQQEGEENKKKLTLPKEVAGAAGVREEEEQYDYHAERNRLDEEISSMPPIKVEERKRLAREKIGGHYRTSRRGIGLSEIGKDNAVIALLIIFIVSPVPAIVLGLQYNNWTAIIYGLVILFALAIIGGIYSGKSGHHNSSYYYYGAASSGRGFRMWAVDKATRKRG